MHILTVGCVDFILNSSLTCDLQIVGLKISILFEIRTVLLAVSLFAIFQSHYLYVTSFLVNTSVVTKLKWSLIWR